MDQSEDISTPSEGFVLDTGVLGVTNLTAAESSFTIGMVLAFGCFGYLVSQACIAWWRKRRGRPE